MNAYLTQTWINLKLTYRDKVVLFFNYAFPLIFFFVFAGLYKAERGGAIVQVLTMVMTIGILGTGFFGAGIRAVQDRELGILRRFKVAPIDAGPILISSMVTGLVNYLPVALVMILLSHYLYGMPFPQRWLSLLVFISLGVVAFRAIGLIIASVVNSAQESQILIQLLYFPMLMLSGATIPISFLPDWLQIVSQFLPSTHLITSMQAILGRGETFGQNFWSAAALALTALLATFISIKLFRWEKDEKLPASAKFWIVGALTPFILLGTYQAKTHGSLAKANMLVRDQRRNRTFLIRDVRVFIGDGSVIEAGGVLVKGGKIEEIYTAATPDPKELNADVIEGTGKTLIPGLIDVHVQLASTGGLSDSAIDPAKSIPRELAAYLYSGVTAVMSVGDPLDQVTKWRAAIRNGTRLGAELFLCGPVLTTGSAPEARQMVAALKSEDVDGIQAILSNRMDPRIPRAIGEEALARRLPLMVHTGDTKDMAAALDAGANAIEPGSTQSSTRDVVPAEVWARMKQRGVVYIPMLSVLDALGALAEGKADGLLDRTLVQQVGPAGLLASTRRILAREKGRGTPLDSGMARQNLLAAWQAGVPLVTGSGAGSPLVWHGPAVHREMQLWVEAGIPAEAALRAATFEAARWLRADDRIGLIRKGREASMVLLNGNPLKDIRDSENIVAVFFKGERIERPELFAQN